LDLAGGLARKRHPLRWFWTQSVKSRAREVSGRNIWTRGHVKGWPRSYVRDCPLNLTSGPLPEWSGPRRPVHMRRPHMGAASKPLFSRADGARGPVGWRARNSARRAAGWAPTSAGVLAGGGGGGGGGPIRPGAARMWAPPSGATTAAAAAAATATVSARADNQIIDAATRTDSSGQVSGGRRKLAGLMGPPVTNHNLRAASSPSRRPGAKFPRESGGRQGQRIVLPPPPPPPVQSRSSCANSLYSRANTEIRINYFAINLGFSLEPRVGERRERGASWLQCSRARELPRADGLEEGLVWSAIKGLQMCALGRFNFCKRARSHWRRQRAAGARPAEPKQAPTSERSGANKGFLCAEMKPDEEASERRQINIIMIMKQAAERHGADSDVLAARVAH